MKFPKFWKFQTFVAFLALAALASADQAPAYGQDYPDVAPLYNFAYNVYNQGEHYEHQNFKQEENRDGYQTHGEYSVQLPDGRIQRVVYRVDGDSGKFPQIPAYSRIFPSPKSKKCKN